MKLDKLDDVYPQRHKQQPFTAMEKLDLALWNNAGRGSG
jgi:hypothetical protein